MKRSPQNARSGWPESRPDLTGGQYDGCGRSVKVPERRKVRSERVFARTAVPIPKLDRVRHVFGSGGSLSRVLDGYEAREEQAELADAV